MVIVIQLYDQEKVLIEQFNYSKISKCLIPSDPMNYPRGVILKYKIVFRSDLGEGGLELESVTPHKSNPVGIRNFVIPQ